MGVDSTYEYDPVSGKVVETTPEPGWGARLKRAFDRTLVRTHDAVAEHVAKPVAGLWQDTLDGKHGNVAGGIVYATEQTFVHGLGSYCAGAADMAGNISRFVTAGRDNAFSRTMKTASERLAPEGSREHLSPVAQRGAQAMGFVGETAVGWYAGEKVFGAVGWGANQAALKVLTDDQLLMAGAAISHGRKVIGGALGAVGASLEPVKAYADDAVKKVSGAFKRTSAPAPTPPGITTLAPVPSARTPVAFQVPLPRTPHTPTPQAATPAAAPKPPATPASTNATAGGATSHLTRAQEKIAHTLGKRGMLTADELAQYRAKGSLPDNIISIGRDKTGYFVRRTAQQTDDVIEATQSGGGLTTRPLTTRITRLGPNGKPVTEETVQQTLLSRAASLSPNGQIAALEQKALEAGAKLIGRSDPQRTFGNMWGLLGRRVTTQLEIPGGMRMPGLSRMGGNVGRQNITIKPGEIGWRVAKASGPKVGKGGVQTLNLVRHERTALGHAVRAATLPIRAIFDAYKSLSALPGRIAEFFAKAPFRLLSKPFRMAALHTFRPLMRTKLFQGAHKVATAPIRAFNWGMRQIGRGVTTTAAGVGVDIAANDGQLTLAAAKKGAKMYIEHLMNQMRDNPGAAFGTLLGSLAGLWAVTKAFGVGAFLAIATGLAIFGARAYFGIGNAGDSMDWVDRQVDKILGRHADEQADGQQPEASQAQASAAEPEGARDPETQAPDASATGGTDPDIAEPAQAQGAEQEAELREEEPELTQVFEARGSHRRRGRRAAAPSRSSDATGNTGLGGGFEFVAQARRARGHQTGERGQKRETGAINHPPAEIA